MSGIQGAVRGDETYALISSYGIYDRDIHQKLFKKVPRAGALSWMRALEGRMSKRKVRRHTYSFYEEGQFFKAATTIASTTTSGNDVLVTLSAGDHQESGTESFPVVGQLAVFEDESVGHVTVVNTAADSAHVITIEPVNASEDVISAAVTGSTVVFFSNAQKEKSTGTTARVPKVVKIDNGIQTFREKYEVTDWSEQNEVEFEYNGSKHLYVKGTDDTADRFALQEELGLLIGKADDGNLTGGAKTVKALIPQITDSGKTMEYFGSPDMTTFDDAILILNKAFGDHEYIVGQGLDVNLKLKNWLVDFAQAGTGNISFNAFSGGAQQALSMNFKSVHIEPFSFHFQTWDVLSHSDSLGAGNMPYKDMMIFIPTGKTKNPNVQDGEKDYEPYMQLAYAPIGGSSLENKGDYKLFETGANAKSGATNDEMTREIHWVSYKGIEIRCRNKFLIARKSK
jgi:hypothetical protein